MRLTLTDPHPTNPTLRRLHRTFYDKRYDYAYQEHICRFCPASDNAPHKRLHDVFGSQTQAIYLACTSAAYYQKCVARLYHIFRALKYKHCLLLDSAVRVFNKRDYSKFGAPQQSLFRLLCTAQTRYSNVRSHRQRSTTHSLNSLQHTSRNYRLIRTPRTRPR